MLRIEPVHDDGQRLPGLHGHVIGLIDTAEQLDSAVDRLIANGFSEPNMICLAGTDGIALIERVERHYFGDSENEIGKSSISALREGKLVFAVKVRDGDEAQSPWCVPQLSVLIFDSELDGRSEQSFDLLLRDCFGRLARSLDNP